jgi:hypothetical protein
LNVPEPQSTETLPESAESEGQKLNSIPDTEEQVQEELGKGDIE